MDRQGRKKRAREQEGTVAGNSLADALDFAFEEVAAGTAAVEGEAWRQPPGVFEFPWQKCHGGLGVSLGVAGSGSGSGAGGGWELRDVFFRSLVDGGAAAIGVPGDRLSPPPSKRALFDDVDAWLAAAGDGEVDPVWRSVLKGPTSSSWR